MERCSSRGPLSVSFLVAALTFWSCGTQARNGEPPAGGEGGGEETGGATGNNPGTGGAKPAPSTGGTTGSSTGGNTGSSTGGNTGGASATGGASGDTGGSGPTPDAGPEPGTGGSGAGGSTATGQGPVAEGKIVFSQDFEQNMDGMSRSPNSLPEDRIQIIDDPIKQRGKIVRIQYKAGDNFRTSGGTEPRSWFSSAMGYTAKGGTHVSVAFGFMWDNPSMGAHFSQIIRDGGPLWMMDVDRSGTLTAAVHRGSGSGKYSMKIEANKWYDILVNTEYKAGGKIQFFVNGQMIATGTGDGGANGRFDCGIYWDHGAKAERTVYVSNVSIGEK